jgi:hypothetical protein
MMGKGPSDVAVFLTSDRGAGTRTDRAVAADAEKARKLIAMALNSWGWQKVQGWRSVSGYSLFGLTEKITDPKYREALRGVLQDFGLTDDAQPEHELLASKLDKAIGPLMSGAYAKPVPLVASFFRALLLRCRCSDDFLIDLWRRHRNLWGEPGHDQFFWNEACIDFGFPDSDLRTWSDFAALTRRLRLALEMVGGIEGIGVTHIVGALLGGHLKSFATSEDLELLFSWIDHYIAGGNREQLISHKDARYGTLKSICIGMIDTAEKTKIMRFFRQRGFFSPVAFEIKEAWAKDED